MATNGFPVTLQRVERIITGAEEITRKQAAILQLDLASQLYYKIVAMDQKIVPRSEYKVLKTRVTIALSLIMLMFAVVGAVAAGAGG